MCQEAPAVDRATAHKLNPLVSSLWTEDTLDSLSGVIDDMGYFLSMVANQPEGQDPHFGRLYLLFGAISAAVAYEVDNLHSVVQSRKERNHA